jgi:tRNA pseudouridine55 synthase
LDIENITNIKNIKNIDIKTIKNNLQSLKGVLKYLPPKYSAKRINGKRAYSLARDGIEFEMKQIVSKVYDTKLISYNHPFITFDISVTQGAYIRSIAQILLQRLGTIGTLSYLNRLNEGKFKFEDEKSLNPLEFLDLEQNIYIGSKQWFSLGKKLDISYFKKKENKKYLVVFDDFFAIIKIQNDEVKYVLNKIVLGKF